MPVHIFFCSTCGERTCGPALSVIFYARRLQLQACLRGLRCSGPCQRPVAVGGLGVALALLIVQHFPARLKILWQVIEQLGA